MIGVAQWRARIGLWNCSRCTRYSTTRSRAVNVKAMEDSKSDSAVLAKETATYMQPETIIPFLFLSLFLSRHMKSPFKCTTNGTANFWLRLVILGAAIISESLSYQKM